MSPAATSRRESQQRTRQKLVESAEEVFAERGIDGASVEEIARRAGYTKGAFYANFDSKEELFLTIVDERFTREAARVEAMLGEGTDPRRQAEVTALDFVRTVHADPERALLFFEFTVRAARQPAFREHLAERYDTLRQRLVDVYARWGAAFADEPPLPLEDIATMTYCMANGFLVERLIEPDLPDELYATMMGMFFRGLQATAADRQASG